jgi:hypothetical protein
MTKPLINGNTYSWADIVFNVMGIPVAGVTAIRYADNEEMEDVRGAGKFAVARGHGAVTFDGSITLHSEEVNALVNASPTGRIQDIPEFTIIVAYLPPSGVIVTHKLKHVRFKNNPTDTRTGDLTIEKTIDLLIGDIQYK